MCPSSLLRLRLRLYRRDSKVGVWVTYAYLLQDLRRGGFAILLKKCCIFRVWNTLRLRCSTRIWTRVSLSSLRALLAFLYSLKELKMSWTYRIQRLRLTYSTKTSLWNSTRIVLSALAITNFLCCRSTTKPIERTLCPFFAL